MNDDGLSAAEIETLGNTLDGLAGKGAMNLETMDGFFAALICGPDAVTPQESLSEVLGDAAGKETGVLAKHHGDLLALILRHWNSISRKFESGDLFFPLLFENDDGIAHANDWAKGFMRCIDLRRGRWSRLLEDDDQSGSLVAIMILAHEHDPDPEMRPYDEPVDAERREQLIVGAATGVNQIWRYFADDRHHGAPLNPASVAFRRAAGKIVRNRPCRCGSGQKYRDCCGASTPR